MASLSSPDLADYRAQSGVFETWRPIFRVPHPSPARANRTSVGTIGVYQLLHHEWGSAARWGGFSASENDAPVVIISDGLWKRASARTVDSGTNGLAERRQVHGMGVAPPGFTHFPRPG